MKMRLERDGQGLISGYGEGVIGIDGVDYRSNLLLLPGRVVEDWYAGAPEALEAEHFAALFEERPEGPPAICVLGTGGRQVFPPPALGAALGARGVALEVMDTRAACRTYSVLVGEGRSVAAALMQIGSDHEWSDPAAG